MDFKPVGKNILLQKKAVEEVKVGILIMPDKKPAFIMCTVCGIGEKVETPLSLDQQVMIHPNAGMEIEYEGTSYLMVDEKAILGVITNGR